MEQMEYGSTDGKGGGTSFFSAGSVLSRTFSTMCGNLIVFFGLTLVASLPAFFVLLLLPLTRWSVFGQMLLSMLCNQLILGSVAYAAYRVLTGDSASIGDSLMHGMSRLPSLVGATLLVALGTGTILFLGGMLGRIFPFSLIFIVLALMLMCMWSVVVPACVVERLGPVESMQRSVELTKDFRMKIFGLLLLVNIVSRLIDKAAEAVIEGTASPSILMALILLLVQAIPQTFANIMPAIIYYDLRTAKEGITLESLADVFD